MCWSIVLPRATIGPSFTRDVKIAILYGLESTPPTPIGATPQSKLQYTYSINGIPNIPNKPTPSILDLDGQKPSNSYDVTAPPEGLGRI